MYLPDEIIINVLVFCEVNNVNLRCNLRFNQLYDVVLHNKNNELFLDYCE
jgi:hypothetical protein